MKICCIYKLYWVKLNHSYGFDPISLCIGGLKRMRECFLWTSWMICVTIMTKLICCKIFGLVSPLTTEKWFYTCRYCLWLQVTWVRWMSRLPWAGCCWRGRRGGRDSSQPCASAQTLAGWCCTGRRGSPPEPPWRASSSGRPASTPWSRLAASPPLGCDRSGGGGLVEETADFQQLPGAHPRHQASRQSWSVAIRNFLTSPFPFDCSGLLGSGKCCSVIISCGCGSRPGHRARIGAKLFPGEGSRAGRSNGARVTVSAAAAKADAMAGWPPALHWGGDSEVAIDMC